MELCQASLDKLFLNDGDPQKYCGPMPPREDVLHQLAVGLEYIHSNELIHGNIKPANVLIWVDSNSSPDDSKVLMKWADFKLSTLNHEIKGSTLSERAFEWLAPEISEMLGIEETEEFELSGATSSRLKVTTKSDVFAAGLVFGYFLLDGRHLYGSVSRDIIININKQNPVNLKGNYQLFYLCHEQEKI
jgi:serine/threonine protein kinase